MKSSFIYSKYLLGDQATDKVDAEKTKDDSSKPVEQTKEEPLKKSSEDSKRDTSAPLKSSTPASKPQVSGSDPNKISGTRSETRVKMSRMRLKIAERLKDAQNTCAMLTTFNEIDMR
jgi:2-oxoglutarate dehydrogenase E2 component (dihydrolipoamide succinyltransferase)